MATLYDEEGNEVSDVLTGDQAKELQEKLKEFEEKASKVEQLEEIVKEKEAELTKYQSKDLNFSNFRKATKEKQEELLKDFSDKEQTLIKEISSLREDVETYQAKNLENYEKEVITALVGNDEEVQTKLKEQAKEFVGTPMTQEEVFRRYKMAYTLLEGKQPSVNPVNKFTPTSTFTTPGKKKKGFVDSEAGQEAYKRWFKDSPLNKKKEDK